MKELDDIITIYYKSKLLAKDALLYDSLNNYNQLHKTYEEIKTILRTASKLYIVISNKISSAMIDCQKIQEYYFFLNKIVATIKYNNFQVHWFILQYDSPKLYNNKLVATQIIIGLIISILTGRFIKTVICLILLFSIYYVYNYL
jgi:hypothetical protein